MAITLSSSIARLSTGFLKAFGYLPPRLARPIAAALAQLTIACRPQDLRVAFRNLELAFPDWSASQRRQTVKRLARNLGWMGAEFARFPRYDQKSLDLIVRLSGTEHITQALRKGNGVILLGGHLCPWELLAFAMSKYGIRMTLPVRSISVPELDVTLNRYRALSGNAPVPRNNCAAVMVRELRANRLIGMFIDEDVPLCEKPVFVDFFGIPAATSTSAARLARLTRAAVIPVFIHWDKSDRKYQISILPEIEMVRTDDIHRDIHENTARFSRVLEGFVRAHPEQWLWLQTRWRTRPADEVPLFQ